MSETLLALIAFSPIVVAAILLVGLNWPAKRAMPVAFGLTVLIAIGFWDMSNNRVIASIFQGLGITIAVLLRGDVLSPWLLASVVCVASGIYLVNSEKPAKK